MKDRQIRIKHEPTTDEQLRRKNFLGLFRECPIAEDELLSHLGLFMRRQSLSRVLFMNELYKKIVDVHGIVMEFGVRWGQNMALFESFRGIYEPYNHNRKIIGFDTFEGFPEVHEKDGDSDIISAGSYSVTEKYEEYLGKVLDFHEKESPVGHIKKYDIIKGDASVEIVKYLENNPQTIIALAYFDFDIYKPTRDCLNAIKKHLTKGSVVGFDQLNSGDYPGETLALQETFGVDQQKIRRSPYASVSSYMVIE